MRKLILIFLILALTLTLVSCSKSIVNQGDMEPISTMHLEPEPVPTSQSLLTETGNHEDKELASTPHSDKGPSSPPRLQQPVQTDKNELDGSHDNNNQDTPKPTEAIVVPDIPKNTISISIKGPPAVGVILESTSINFKEGMTVFDALKSITTDKKIRLDASGLLPGTQYVKGINEIYQFDEGPGSGWLYSVNGVPRSVGSGSYILNDGDKIEWRYSLDMGKDIGWNQQ